MTVPVLAGLTTATTSSRADTPLLVLGPSLGTTTRLWEACLPELARSFRVLRFDLPGHGRSPAASEPFTIDELAQAVLVLVDAAGGGAFHYAGISLGGAIGLQLAADAPERLASLTVVCSAPRIGTPDGWAERAERARRGGTASLVTLSAERWFAPDFVRLAPDTVGAALGELVDVDDESYALCCEALAGPGERTVTSEVLLVAGAVDAAMPLESVREQAEAMPRARVEVLDGVAHLPGYEAPARLAAIVARHASAGTSTRRAVLGDAHVAAAAARVTPETADFQEFLTRYAWGEVWTRPGLARRERSMITLAALVALRAEDEIPMHLRGALRNGVTRAELSEVLLHTALYAGLPAANSAFARLREVLAELGGTDSGATDPGGTDPTTTNDEAEDRR
ncbi:4-carboxymuconolactone decarboxylase /3-oxoadipate enol-lactonase [Rathayibacter oskolensis]|uniref:4-carboxymuconolactone decarboxylase /3-oxoadipate enol-lactonase n=1 Tax=Rathayibacter oskolensis TaxID=1891671 RepID=A0A1X7NW17_9MICO|nr:alpha/beta fold hydrolase [Rathayibacter oskolensis]SMH42478.1 4-carboxymuconolactone decarboxylase /3-oxoadipate enol-lactonase [Rathayibacter oskolensis]